MTLASQSANDAPVAKPRYFVNGDKDAYQLKIELPGVSKDGVSINLNENILAIRAKRKSAVPSDWKVLNRELHDLDFALRLKLNAPVDADKMTAKLEDGILTVRLPVKEAAKPRRIEIK